MKQENKFWEIGKNYMIRTVTMIQVGKLVNIDEFEIILQDAAWIAETGRFTDFLLKGMVKEVEPFPDGNIAIGRGSLIDATKWNFELLRKQI